MKHTPIIVAISLSLNTNAFANTEDTLDSKDGLQADAEEALADSEVTLTSTRVIEADNEGSLTSTEIIQADTDAKLVDTEVTLADDEVDQADKTPTLAAAGSALEQTDISNSEVRERTIGWDYELSLSYLSLDAAAASAQGLGDGAFALEISANYSFTPNLVASAGLAFANIQDDSQFSQRVVDSFNNVETAESTASAIPVFAEFQYRNILPGDSGVEYRAGLGYTGITNDSRDITNCINCRTSDFELEGGAYLMGSFGKEVSSKSAVGFTARQYMTGDLNNSVLLWWRISPRR